MTSKEGKPTQEAMEAARKFYANAVTTEREVAHLALLLDSHAAKERLEREIDTEQAAISDCLEIVRNFYKSAIAQRIHHALVSMANDKLQAKRAALEKAVNG